MSKATQLAAQGGGTVTFIGGSGNRAQVTASVGTRVEGPDGGPEVDAPTRERVISERVENAIAEITAAATSEGPGRPFLPEQRMIADLAPAAGLPYSVIWVGFGMSDKDPTDHRQQVLGMEPSQAVDTIRDRLTATSGASYTLIFTAAAGSQEPLNTTTSQWRRAWWFAMAKTTGATVERVDERNIPAPPPVGAAPAGVIPNITELTVPGPPAASPDPTIAPPPASDPPPAAVPKSVPPAVLAGALFSPDQATWVSEERAREQLQALADAWKAHPDGTYLPLRCEGRTARYGDPDTARALAAERAAQALALATSMGISSTAPPVGLGYDQPLPNYPPTAPEQRAVTCRLAPATP